jgi:hypothetical protein
MSKYDRKSKGNTITAGEAIESIHDTLVIAKLAADLKAMATPEEQGMLAGIQMTMTIMAAQTASVFSRAMQPAAPAAETQVAPAPTAETSAQTPT